METININQQQFDSFVPQYTLSNLLVNGNNPVKYVITGEDVTLNHKTKISLTGGAFKMQFDLPLGLEGGSTVQASIYSVQIPQIVVSIGGEVTDNKVEIYGFTYQPLECELSYVIRGRKTPSGKLLFHAPLDSQNRLKELVSGRNLTINDSTRFVWDSTVNKYKLTTRKHVVPVYFDNLDYDYEPGALFTGSYCIKVKPISYNGSWLALTQFCLPDQFAGTPFISTGRPGSNYGFPVVSTGTEVSVICTWNNGVGKCYLNGALISSLEGNCINPVSNSKIMIGYSPYNECEGTFYASDIRLYNKVLTASEIQNY